MLLPKAIVVILDDDLIDDIDWYRPGFSFTVGRIVEWLFNKFHRLITAHKEKLPSKSRKFKFPTILWALVPKHDIYGHYNEYKDKFNKSLQNTASLFREMGTLQLNDWDPSCLNYFAEGKISAYGLSTYWMSINNAFEKWDRDQMNAVNPHFDQRKLKSYDNARNFQRQKLKSFHREANTEKFKWRPEKTRFKLPSVVRPNDSRRSSSRF